MIPWLGALLLAWSVQAQPPAGPEASPEPLPPAVGLERLQLPAVAVRSLAGGAALWEPQQPAGSLAALELLLTLPADAVDLATRDALALLPALIDAGPRGAPPGGLDPWLEPLGASVLLSAEPTGLRLRLLAPPAALGPALAVLEEALREPALSARACRRERGTMERQLARQRASATGVLQITERSILYSPEHLLAPLALRASPPRCDQLRRAHRLLLDQGGATLVWTGVAPGSPATAALEERLGWLGAPPAPERAWLPRPEAGSCRPSFIADEGASQLRLSVSWLVPESISWAEAQLVADVLGGGATARLDRRLREELGLVYEARARLIREPGHLRLRVSMRVSNEQAVEALAALQEELRALGAIDATELQRARATRGFALARQLDGAEPSAGLFREWARLGSNPEQAQEELDAMAGLDAEELAAAAGRLLSPARAHWVILGDGPLLATLACGAGLMPGCDREGSAGPSIRFCAED